MSAEGRSLCAFGARQASVADHHAMPGLDHDAYFDAAAAILSTVPVQMGDDRLADVLMRHYGVRGEVRLLSSEIETTAEIVLPDARRLILKASPQPEAVASFRFQSTAIRAVEEGAGFVSPDVIPTLAGELMFRQDGLSGYLQTRLAGSALHQLLASPLLLRSAGTALAHLDLALRGHDLPAINRPVLWNIGCWPGLARFQHHLQPGPTADRVQDALVDYTTRIQPRLCGLDWQVTHNDPSPFNMLVAGEHVGFIDFGDGCPGPRIQDLAIAASHLVGDEALPLGGAEALIAGYASICPISPLEADLLVGLMKARQSALILINAWRSHLFPDHAAYINKNVPRGEKGLSILSRLSTAQARDAVCEAVAAS